MLQYIIYEWKAVICVLICLLSFVCLSNHQFQIIQDFQRHFINRLRLHASELSSGGNILFEKNRVIFLPFKEVVIPQLVDIFINISLISLLTRNLYLSFTRTLKQNTNDSLSVFQKLFFSVVYNDAISLVYFDVVLRCRTLMDLNSFAAESCIQFLWIVYIESTFILRAEKEIQKKIILVQFIPLPENLTS